MIKNKNAFIIALVFPIIALLSLTAYKKYIVSVGKKIIFPISGYDPRDLLSGHYLVYSIDYGVENICPPHQGDSTGYVCLEPKMFSYSKPSNCLKFIRGICNANRFEAGVEKFYIPEDQANKLDKQIRTGAASIVLSVTPDGQAQVNDLLINGQPWNMP